MFEIRQRRHKSAFSSRSTSLETKWTPPRDLAAMAWISRPSAGHGHSRPPRSGWRWRSVAPRGHRSIVLARGGSKVSNRGSVAKFPSRAPRRNSMACVFSGSRGEPQSVLPWRTRHERWESHMEAGRGPANLADSDISATSALSSVFQRCIVVFSGESGVRRIRAPRTPPLRRH